jgi:DNA polymerase-1
MIERSEEIEGLSGLRGAKGIREKVESSLETLRLSKRLVALDTEVKPFNEMRLHESLAVQAPNTAALSELCNELEFESLRLQILKSRGVSTVQPTVVKEYILVSAETFPDFLASLNQTDVFAFDSETTSLDVLLADIIGLSFSWSPGKAYYLPFRTPQVQASLLDDGAVKPRALDKRQVLAALKPIFENPKVRKVGFHAKYDIAVLRTAGVEVKGLVFDPLLASYVLRPDIREHGLSALSLRYLREPMRDYKEVVGAAAHLGDVAVEDVCEYACHDADVTWRLYEDLLAQLTALGTEPNKPLAVLEQIEVPLVPVLEDMERTGIAVDIPFLQGLEREFSAEAERLQIEIFAIAGEEFNLNSPKQLSEVLFERIGLSTKGVKKTKTGYSTDASVLQRISDQHPIIEAILQYREVHKLNSTYVEALQRLVHPLTGRIHTSFNQAVAATGRLSSSDPNLQNIPIRNPRGKRLRAAFIAAPGMKLLSADYSQIELRVLAHLCGDEALCEAFRMDEDIHARTARELFGVADESSEEFSQYRRYAKTINFGIIYGMSSFRLARELSISRAEAEQFIERYFARYPKVKEYFEDLRKKSEQLGYVETLFGRRRYVEDLETEGRDAGYASRSMMNAPIQGTAAEIIKIAMIRLHELLTHHSSGARMVLQVHDELVFEVPDAHVVEIKRLIEREMESAVELQVPLRVSMRSGDNWGLV